MKIKIHVTKEILEKSKMCSSFYPANCAIAHAVRGLMPTAEVQSRWISMEDPWTEDIRLPEEACMFIRDFDEASSEERAVMTPISFDIDVPDSWINEIGIDQVHAILKESKTLSLA